MQTVGFLVRMRLPDTISPEQALRDLRTSIAFGSPEIRIHYIIPDLKEVSDGVRKDGQEDPKEVPGSS